MLLLWHMWEGKDRELCKIHYAGALKEEAVAEG